MKTPPRQQGPAGPGPEQAALAVREATPDDAPLVHSMVRAIAAGTGQADRVESTAAGLARDGFGPGRAFTALLAFAGEEPLGLAIYYPEYSSWRGQRGACLLDLYVAPAARRRGVGALLVAETARRSRREGAAYLRLSVDSDDQRARAFYRARGFAASPRELQLFLDGAAFDAQADC